jgi:hypothetical protein
MFNTNTSDLFDGTLLTSTNLYDDENINNNYFNSNINYNDLIEQNLILTNENFDLKKKLNELNLKYEKVNNHLSFITNLFNPNQNSNFYELKSTTSSTSTVEMPNDDFTVDSQKSYKLDNTFVSNLSEDKNLLQDYFLYLNRDFSLLNKDLMLCSKKNKYLNKINDYFFNLIQKNILKLPIKTFCKFNGSIKNTTNILNGPYIGRFTYVIEMCPDNKSLKKNNIFVNNINIIENFFKKEIDVSKIYLILKNGNNIENKFNILKSNKNYSKFYVNSRDITNDYNKSSVSSEDITNDYNKSSELTEDITNDYNINDVSYSSKDIINFEGKIQNISGILNKLNNSNINFDFDYQKYQYYEDNLQFFENKLNEFVKIIRKDKNYLGFDIIIGDIFIIEILFTKFKINTNNLCKKNDKIILNNVNKVYSYFHKYDIINLDNYLISEKKLLGLDIIGYYYKDRQEYIKRNLNDNSFFGSEIKNIIRLFKYFVTNEVTNVNNVNLYNNFIGFTKNNSDKLKEINFLNKNNKKVVSEYFIEVLCIKIVKENFNSVIDYISNTYKVKSDHEEFSENDIVISKKKKYEIFTILMMKKIFEFISSRISKEEINKYLLKSDIEYNSSNQNLSYSKIIIKNSIFRSIDNFVIIDPVIPNHNICLEEDKQSLLDIIIASININNYLDQLTLI